MTGDKWRRMVYRVLAVAAVVAAVAFLLYSSQLASELAGRERQRMMMWADAVEEVLSSPDGSHVGFAMTVVEETPGIPALLVDDDGVVLMSRNLPDDSVKSAREADRLVAQGNVLSIKAETGGAYKIYYGDSDLLKRLRRFPYVELVVIIAFLAVAYVALRSSRRAEENRIWLGLSRETAHQLGTPISSLMGWIACLKAGMPEDEVEEAVEEMERDVDRLADVSARFSKIGTCPPFLSVDMVALTESVVAYMRRRVSTDVVVTVDTGDNPVEVTGSAELLRWVMENLIKNAADAIAGHGEIRVSLRLTGRGAELEVADTGKGIPRNKWRRIFKAGYTTKGRGWGVGLTLAQRIVEQYHRGSIAVVASGIGRGTTFRVVIP